MKKQVHPLVAIVLIAAVLVGVWYCYTVLYSGQVVLDHKGGAPPPSGPAIPISMNGPPSSGAKAPAAPGHGKPAAPSAAKPTK